MKKLSILGIFISLLVVSISFFYSCSNDVDITKVNASIGSSKMSKAKCNTKQLDYVLDSLFADVRIKHSGHKITLKVCDDLVETISSDLNPVKTKLDVVSSNVRFKVANPETVKLGWTYLGEVTGTISAISLYNKFKKKWNYTCVELRLETDGSTTNVYAKKC